MRRFVATAAAYALLAACEAAELPADPDANTTAADAGLIDTADAGSKDADADAAIEDAAIEDATIEDAAIEDAAIAVGPARYAFGRDHSPLTPSVVEHLRAIRSGDPQVFAKVGDSITESSAFLRCFGGTRYDLATHDLAATRDHFAAGDAAGTTPYQRDSLAAVSGWSAWAPLRGSPSPLDQELAAIDPAFAVVMYGTNDIDTMNLVFYGENMIALLDALLEKNLIPILSSIPPRDDTLATGAEVARYSLVARALAEARQIPFIDLESRMRALPDHGLAGDGVHPRSDPRGACVLDGPGLSYGYNLRNLLTLEALDRVRRTLIENEPHLDPDDPPRPGRGTRDDPLIIDTLPYTDARDTAHSTERHIDQYACAAQDESGPETYYRLDLDVPRRLRAVVIDRPGTDIDLHHLANTPSAETCDDRNDRELTLDLQPGVHYFVLDTFQGDANAGEYLFVLSE